MPGFASDRELLRSVAGIFIYSQSKTVWAKDFILRGGLPVWRLQISAEDLGAPEQVPGKESSQEGLPGPQHQP